MPRRSTGVRREGTQLHQNRGASRGPQPGSPAGVLGSDRVVRKVTQPYWNCGFPFLDYHWARPGRIHHPKRAARLGTPVRSSVP